MPDKESSKLNIAITAAPRVSVGRRSVAMGRTSKRSASSMARAYKLAQYFRVIPCLYSEQIFCFAACLLKWFRLEAMRQEALSASLVKGHHAERQPTQPGPVNSIFEAKASAPDVDGDDAGQAVEEEQEEEVAESHNVGAMLEEPVTSEQEEVAMVVEGEEEEGKVEESDMDGGESVKDVEPANSDDGEAPPERPIYGTISKSVLPRITYGSVRERTETYRLAFSAMKYYAILDKLLDEITFFMEYPDLKEEEYLILVLVYDYSMRNFQRRVPLPHDRELPTPEVYFEYLPSNRLVIYPPGNELFSVAEAAVQAMSMRLAAAVARVRVRNQVGSLRLLLPEEWRSSEQMADVMPAYGWYNQLLGKQDIVTTWLKERGFRRIMAGRSPQPLEYASDKHCSDVFIFNKVDVGNLMESEIFEQKNLVLQDKSSCLAVHCCLSNVGGTEEVLFVNSINTYSAVHMEGLIGNKFPLIQPVPQIRLLRPLKEDEDVRLTQKMGSKVVRATTEEFISLEPNNEKNRVIRHIFIEASDTRSGVVNPIGFLEVEADDLSILRDMWTQPGNTSKETRRVELVNKSAALLKHALKFSSVRTVTYFSHSEDVDETDGLVARIVETTNRILLREAEVIAATSRNVSTGLAFNPQIPVFPGLQEEREAYDTGKTSIISKNKSIKVEASGECNGFYIVILHKEQILLKSAEELKHDAEQQGRSGKETKGKGKGKKHTEKF